jgi:hypothetical protein
MTVYNANGEGYFYGAADIAAVKKVMDSKGVRESGIFEYTCVKKARGIYKGAVCLCNGRSFNPYNEKCK